MADPHSALNEHPAARQPPLTLQEHPHRGHLNLRGQPDDQAFVQAMTTVGQDHSHHRANRCPARI